MYQFITGITGKPKEEFPLPTSGELQKKSEKATLGYTTPRTEHEKKSDEIAADIASFAYTPGGRLFKGSQKAQFGKKLAQVVGLPIAGELAKEGVGHLGGEEGAQTAAKVGTMLMLDLATSRGGGSKKYINGLWKNVDDMIPAGATADATKLSNGLNTLLADLKQGGTTPRTAAAIQKIEEVLKAIDNGQISSKELTKFRKSINDNIDQLGGFDFNVPKSQRIASIDNLNKVKKEVIESFNEYAAQNNPELAKMWHSANEASAVQGQSNGISNFIRKQFGDKFKSVAGKSLFGLVPAGAYSAVVNIPATIAAGGIAAGTATAYQAGKLIYKITNSPTLRQYYKKVLEGATKQNSQQVIQNLTQLDNKLYEEEQKKKAKFKKLSS